MPYTIGIDARKIQDFGIGTYVRNLVRSLAAIDSENRYILLAKPGDHEALRDLPENFQVALESSPASVKAVPSTPPLGFTVVVVARGNLGSPTVCFATL